jgi:hypothetical protein
MIDADPEPVLDDEGEETGAYHCPDCHDICWNEAKALACCADEGEDGDSPETPNESAAEAGSGDANPTPDVGETGSLPAAAFDPVTDPAFDGSTEAVREHYRRAGPLLDAIESVGDSLIAGFTGNSGIYRTRYEHDLELHELEAGHRAHQRPIALGHDRSDLLDAIEFDPDEDSWRSAYLHLPYKDPDALFDGAYLDAERYDADEWFDAGEGLPDYADICALPFWIDVDLADDRKDALDPEDEIEFGADLKARRGDLDPREHRVVERAFEAIVAEVADVYDLPPEAIAAFDSGGGFYPFGPAAATLPIAERYDEESRERLFDELTDRVNAYVAGDEDTPGTVDAYGFEGIIPRVEERVPGAKYLLDTDALLNKNRQAKAPGSIHKTHDVVVTPLRDESGTVDYTPTTVSEFAESDDLLDRTVAEARKFTEDTPEARACVDPLVETLFPEYAARDDLDGWADVLDAWLTDDWRRERARVHASARDDKRRRARREELKADLDREPTDEEVSEALADQQITTIRQDVFDALDRIDVEEIIRTYAADEWDTSNRGHETTFDPSWRTSGSGMSCAVPNGGDTFVDNSCNGGGGPAKAYALGEGILVGSDTAAANTLRGRQWGEAVDGLRGEGYDIPVYIPEAGENNSDGEEYDETPLWALRKAAVALDVCSPDEFKEHETEDGETYLGFDRETFNGVLDALDEASVDHGREHIDSGESDGRQYAPEACTPPAFDPEEFDREQRWQELQDERYEDFLDTTGPHVFGDPAGVGKSTNAELGAAGRDRPYFAAFDKHEKAREAITDDVTPDEKFHLKGGEQPVHGCCLDADADAGEGETPHCSEHGHPADWPRMCPIYERGKDDDLRRRYEALVGALGPRGAHIALGLFDEDKHPWHDGQCRWAEQFDHLLDEDGRPLAERVAGVHEYQLLKSAPEGRDTIVDESPRPLASEQRVTVEKLAHARVRFESLADVHESDPDDDLGADLRALGEFADDLISALADDDPTTLDDLDAPDIRPAAFDRPVDPDDLPAGVDPEDVERTTWREYQGVNSEHYTEHERTTAPVEDYAEPLAKAKLAYNEGLVRQYRDEDADLPTAPFCVDALLAAAAKAGIESADVRRAIAVPTTLETCPWCGSSLDDENGARVCASDECDWHEAENSITQQDGQQARASAWADDDPDDLRGERRPALIYGELPDPDDLPDDPLVLDATATREKIAGLYGSRVDDVEITGDAPLDLSGKFELTQVVGGQYGDDSRYHAGGQYHAQTIKDTESIQQRIQTAIESICERHDRPLFGIRGDLVPLFEFPENAEVLKYHAARGLNRSDCDAVCCIGAPHPDVEDIRRKAELLALDNPDLRVGGDEYSTRRNAPNPPVYRKLRYEDESGDGLAVPTKAYSGLVGELFREAREKELEQFIHRIRPHLVDPDDGDEGMKHGYLLTDVPTDLAIDRVAGFEELVDPLYKQADVPEGAMAMQEAALDALDRRENGQPIAGVRPQTLVETDGDEVSMRAEGWQELCRVYGVETRNGSTPSLSTVYDWLERLDALDLLHPGEYEQREGRRHSGSTATLNLALQYLSSNANFKVDVARRFRRFVADGASAETWLSLLAEAFDPADGVSGGHPPPNPTS